MGEKNLLFLLAVIQFSHILDFMIIMPLGKQFMQIFGINPQQFSMIVSIYAGAAFTMSLVSASFIDRFDRKKALLFNFAGFIIGTLACSVANSYVLFLAARALAGAFGGVLGALIMAIVGDMIPYERRASAMGIVMTAFSVASVAGVPAGIFLAAHFTWRAPFLVIGFVASIIFTAIVIWFPSLRGHMRAATVAQPHPLDTFLTIARDPNQLRALLFSVVLMLGHFTIIPFIAPYMQLNVGFSDYQVTYIYLVGGTLTVFLLPLFGKLADRFGNQQVFTLASLFALFSIFAITNLPSVPIALALIATSSFFAVASGRNVPAMTMVTAVVRPENRGGFMSVRASANQLALALGSLIAGMIITKNPDGSLAHYPWVGYFAILMSIIAIGLAWKLTTLTNPTEIPDVSGQDELMQATELASE
ncbi:MAG: MFS transporter [Lewinellaceae bacterium]|nr:MFS transporter [Lewinellaceae bacterium]